MRKYPPGSNNGRIGKLGETREVAPISISEKEKPKGKKKGEFEFLGETSSPR